MSDNETVILDFEKTIVDIEEKIRSLFNSPNYVYKIATIITLNDGRKLEKNIIGKTSGKLITIDEELIDIRNIRNIEF